VTVHLGRDARIAVAEDALDSGGFGAGLKKVGSLSCDADRGNECAGLGASPRASSCPSDSGRERRGRRFGGRGAPRGANPIRSE
jgi:hypothetical protein